MAPTKLERTPSTVQAITISTLLFTAVPTALFLSAIVCGYLVWLLEGKDPFLPTISNTWDTAPGTYFSRWLVGAATGGLALLQVFVFPEPAAGRGSLKQKLCLRMGLVAVLCLSVVGSVCDSPGPQCKGNDYVHSFFAITWFVLYDGVMLLTSFTEGDLILAVVATGATTLRTTYRTNLWWVACLEWANILLVLMWSARQVAKKPLRWAFGHLGHLKNDVVWSVSSVDLLKVCGAFYLGTLLVSCGVGLWVGYLPPADRSFWFISDMWTQIPGNWLSRWAVMQGFHTGWLAHAAMLLATSSPLRRTGLVVALVALGGLSVVGVCNESENFPLHIAGALVFFYGYDIFAVCAVVDDYLRNVEATVFSRARTASAIVCWACAPVHLRHFLPPAAPDVLAVIEWVNALAIIAFMLLDGLAAHPTQISVGVVRVADGLAKPLL